MAKVVVVGSTNTDMTVRVPRLPAPGETVSGGGFRVTGGGKGANQAVAAARAGASVVFVTALGTDDIGDRALDSLAAEGIDLRFVRRVPDAPSGIALILVDDAGENVIAVASGANAALRPEDVEPIAAIVEPGDAVLVQLEIPQPAVEAAVSLAQRKRARLILNPAPARALSGAVLAAVSRADAERTRGGRAGGPGRRRRRSGAHRRRPARSRRARRARHARRRRGARVRCEPERSASRPSPSTPSTPPPPATSSTARWRSR